MMMKQLKTMEGAIAEQGATLREVVKAQGGDVARDVANKRSSAQARQAAALAEGSRSAKKPSSKGRASWYEDSEDDETEES